MKLTRRKFIGAAPALAGAMFGARAAFAQRVVEMMTPAQMQAVGALTWHSFLPFQNTEFTFFDGRRKCVMTLVSMVNSRTGRPFMPIGTKAQNFVLTFATSSRVVFKQGTYAISHFSLGDFALFVTEGGVQNGERLYTAVINRI